MDNVSQIIADITNGVVAGLIGLAILVPVLILAFVMRDVLTALYRIVAYGDQLLAIMWRGRAIWPRDTEANPMAYRKEGQKMATPKTPTPAPTAPPPKAPPSPAPSPAPTPPRKGV